jgi:hypothetical protein
MLSSFSSFGLLAVHYKCRQQFILTRFEHALLWNFFSEHEERNKILESTPQDLKRLHSYICTTTLGECSYSLHARLVCRTGLRRVIRIITRRREKANFGEKGKQNENPSQRMKLHNEPSRKN